MMAKLSIPVADLLLQPFTTFDPEGILLVSGEDTAHANAMTISWGTFGIMWGRPVMMVMVRRSRHTWDFMNQCPDFTVNWMPEDWAEAVRLCGKESGRHMNKFEATGMTPVKGTAVQSPVIEQSALALECVTLYRTEMTPEQCVDPRIPAMYGDGDFHTLYFGEVVAATGVEHFRRA